MSVCLTAYLSACLSVCMHVCLPMPFYRYVYHLLSYLPLYVYMSLYQPILLSFLYLLLSFTHIIHPLSLYLRIHLSPHPPLHVIFPTNSLLSNTLPTSLRLNFPVDLWYFISCFIAVVL